MADYRPCVACGGSGLIPLGDDADWQAVEDETRRWFDTIGPAMTPSVTVPALAPSHDDPGERR